MEMRFIKKLVSFEKDKKTKKFYTFYLQLPNGMKLKVQPNSYKDVNGNDVSNYRELVLVADDELPFDK